MMSPISIEMCTIVYIKVFTLILFFTVIQSKIHLHMSADELEETFGSTSGNVPEYEPILIQYSFDPLLGRREYVKFDAFNETIILILKEVNNLVFSKQTPIWLAEGTEDSMDIQFKKLSDNTFYDATVKFYEDQNNAAGLGVKKTNGSTQFIGNIRGFLSFIKIPDRLNNIWEDSFEKSKNFRIARREKNIIPAKYHIAIKSEAEFIFNTKTNTSSNSSATIYPRIIVFAQYLTSFTAEPTEFRLNKLLVYLICFWNAVNMKFVEFKEPRIKLHITGLVIGNNKWAAPYYTHKLGQDVIREFKFFVERFEKQFEGWDIAVSQSNAKICLNADCKKSILGLAYIGQTCSINDSIQQYSTVSLVTDQLDFTGIVPAAHEIGHLFGAIHDGSSTSLCNDNGYIMSSHDSTGLSLSESWSWCSKLEILTRIRNNPKECWRHTPPINKTDQLPEMLPGNFVNRQDQCKLAGYNDPCNITSCDNLYCWSKGMGSSWLKTCEPIAIPLPGTSCGNNMICKFRICMSENINLSKIL